MKSINLPETQLKDLEAKKECVLRDCYKVSDAPPYATGIRLSQITNFFFFLSSLYLCRLFLILLFEDLILLAVRDIPQQIDIASILLLLTYEVFEDLIPLAVRDLPQQIDIALMLLLLAGSNLSMYEVCDDIGPPISKASISKSVICLSHKGGTKLRISFQWSKATWYGGKLTRGRSGTLIGQGSVTILSADTDYLPYPTGITSAYFKSHLLVDMPSVNYFRMFYMSSYTKGWMSFVKRSDAAHVCYSKPLDSIKNWNDHFFWIDSTAFPLSISLKSKILSKDPPPKLSQYDTEACDFLRTHTIPFRKFSEPFLCWVGISRYYTLDENCYLTFWDGEEGGDGFFAFIRHSDPTKVRIRERNLTERVVGLLKITEGRTVPLDPPVTAASGDSGDSIDKLFDEWNDAGQEHSVEGNDDVLEETIAKDASEVVAEKTKKKRKRKVTDDASGFTHPPKKSRDDYQSLPLNTSRKSLAALHGMIPKGFGIPSGVTEPLLSASVAPMPDVGPVDSVSGINLSLAADAPVVTVAVTTTVVADVAAILRSKSQDESKNLENIGDSASAGGANSDAAIISKLNKPSTSSDSFYASQSIDTKTMHRVYVPRWKVTNDSILDDPYVCLGAERNVEIAHLKSLLSLKKVEAAEAIRLHGQLTTVEAADAIATLESPNVAKETELASLSSQVAKLTSDLSGFQLSRDELNSKVVSLESERDCLITQVSAESAFELFRERIEALQDEQAKDLGDRIAELDAQLHGFKLDILKYLQSSEYLQALGQAIGCAVNKGIQDGLKAGVDHGKAERDLFVVEAYDPSIEGKYVDSVDALVAIDFSLIFELKSKKYSSIVDLMDSLCLEGVLAEIPRAEDLQPFPKQLTLPIHRPKDNVVFAETSLSSSLEVVHLQVQRFRGEVKEKRLSLTDVMTPLIEPLSLKSLTGEASTSAAPITTLSTTFASSTIVPPSLVVSDQVLVAESHNEDPPVVTFEKEELGTSPE
ncbi:hypothetical protein Tco_0359949 [Tanacetum coccineum]